MEIEFCADSAREFIAGSRERKSVKEGDIELKIELENEKAIELAKEYVLKAKFNPNPGKWDDPENDAANIYASSYEQYMIIANALTEWEAKTESE